MSKLGRTLAGGFAGFGKGLSETAGSDVDRLREENLARFKGMVQKELLGDQQTYSSGEAQKERDFRAGEGEKIRQAKKDIAGMKSLDPAKLTKEQNDVLSAIAKRMGNKKSSKDLKPAELQAYNMQLANVGLPPLEQVIEEIDWGFDKKSYQFKTDLEQPQQSDYLGELLGRVRDNTFDKKFPSQGVMATKPAHGFSTLK